MKFHELWQIFVSFSILFFFFFSREGIQRVLLAGKHKIACIFVYYEQKPARLNQSTDPSHLDGRDLRVIRIICILPNGNMQMCASFYNCAA